MSSGWRFQKLKPEVGGFFGSNEGCSVFGGEGRGSLWPRVQAFYLLVEGEENGGGGNGLELVRGSVCGRLETRKRRPTGGAELLIFSRKRGIKWSWTRGSASLFLC